MNEASDDGKRPKSKLRCVQVFSLVLLNRILEELSKWMHFAYLIILAKDWL